MEAVNENTEPTIEQKLGLPEGASKQEVSAGLDDHNRRNRAFSVKLPFNSPWSRISWKYLRIRKKGAPFIDRAEVLDGGGVRHPISGLVTHGTLIQRDLTPIEKGDLCACSDGSWRPCFAENLLYRSCSGTSWVRP